MKFLVITLFSLVSITNHLDIEDLFKQINKDLKTNNLRKQKFVKENGKHYQSKQVSMDLKLHFQNKADNFKLFQFEQGRILVYQSTTSTYISDKFSGTLYYSHNSKKVVRKFDTRKKRELELQNKLYRVLKKMSK